jgi:phosphopantetheine--protein transferase-like protein
VLRIEELPPAEDAAFWLRHLHAHEIAACSRRRHAAVHLAARLAAKRACVAALGSQSGIDERDIVVDGGLGGPPQALVHSWRALTSFDVRANAIALSLSHTARHAGALAVVTDRGDASTKPVRTCGFDLLDAARWELALVRSGEAVIARVTSQSERDADRAMGADTRSLAATRFCVKESVIKALQGLPSKGSFHDIEVMQGLHESGWHVRLRGALAERAHLMRALVASAAVWAISEDPLQSAVILAEAC